MVLTRGEAEDFLYHEAELLDGWALEEWAALYREDALYEVTSPSCADPLAADARNTLFLISDRIDRIRGRARRLLKKTAHAEYPHSKTRHLITNVRVSAGEDGETKVRANFAVWRTKEDTTAVYMGEAFYVLSGEGEGTRVRHKRCVLDVNSLVNQGRLTIIL
jgi:p-cumate 2,3-dioxygenase subunit beta